MGKYNELMAKAVKAVGIPKEFKLSGPQKISVKNRSAFSVPAGPDFACPGATEACEGCYAQKKRHLWSPVQKVLAQNWMLLRRFEKQGRADKAAKAILDRMRPDAKVFRLYESGDFHSQWSIDVWTRVVRARPEVHFWAYTRSFDLNFSSLTRNKNFTLWASTDEYNIKEAKKFVRRFRKSGVKHAYGPWDHDKTLPKNSFVCPAVTHKIELTGACEKCKLCVIKRRTKKNVVFLKH